MGQPARIAVWLFGRGCSVASGLSWTVPLEYKILPREVQTCLIRNAINRHMSKIPVGSGAYANLLDILSNRTDLNWRHFFATTNWDYLLQREISALQLQIKPYWLQDSHVFHLNGTTEPFGTTALRSEILLETDSSTKRKWTHEANKALNIMLHQKFFVIAGMSFNCATDKNFLDNLQKHEDFLQIGDATWVVINSEYAELQSVCSLLRIKFPGCRLIRVEDRFENWIKSGCKELHAEGVIL